jgi:hypothetical protein
MRKLSKVSSKPPYSVSIVPAVVTLPPWERSILSRQGNQPPSPSPANSKPLQHHMARSAKVIARSGAASREPKAIPIPMAYHNSAKSNTTTPHATEPQLSLSRTNQRTTLHHVGAEMAIDRDRTVPKSSSRSAMRVRCADGWDDRRGGRVRYPLDLGDA